MHKIVTHQYFMDEMQMIELPISLKYIEYAEITDWQQTRELMLSVMRPYLKNQHTTAKDIIHLPIDDWYKDMPNEDIEWYKQYVANYKKQQNTIL